MILTDLATLSIRQIPDAQSVQRQLTRSAFPSEDVPVAVLDPASEAASEDFALALGDRIDALDQQAAHEGHAHPARQHGPTPLHAEMPTIEVEAPPSADLQGALAPLARVAEAPHPTSADEKPDFGSPMGPEARDASDLPRVEAPLDTGRDRPLENAPELAERAAEPSRQMPDARAPALETLAASSVNAPPVSRLEVMPPERGADAHGGNPSPRLRQPIAASSLMTDERAQRERILVQAAGLGPPASNRPAASDAAAIPDRSQASLYPGVAPIDQNATDKRRPPIDAPRRNGSSPVADVTRVAISEASDRARPHVLSERVASPTAEREAPNGSLAAAEKAPQSHRPSATATLLSTAPQPGVNADSRNQDLPRFESDRIPAAPGSLSVRRTAPEGRFTPHSGSSGDFRADLGVRPVERSAVSEFVSSAATPSRAETTARIESGERAVPEAARILIAEAAPTVEHAPRTKPQLARVYGAADVAGTRLDSGGVSDRVAEQLGRHIVNRDLQAGRLTVQLNPRELGVIDLEFSRERGEVHIAISPREGATRELIEATLPRLKSQLGDAGVSVGDLSLKQNGSQAERETPRWGRSANSAAHHEDSDAIQTEIAERAESGFYIAV